MILSMNMETSATSNAKSFNSYDAFPSIPVMRMTWWALKPGSLLLKLTSFVEESGVTFWYVMSIAWQTSVSIDIEVIVEITRTVIWASSVITYLFTSAIVCVTFIDICKNNMIGLLNGLRKTIGPLTNDLPLFQGARGSWIAIITDSCYSITVMSVLLTPSGTLKPN